MVAKFCSRSQGSRRPGAQPRHDGEQPVERKHRAFAPSPAAPRRPGTDRAAIALRHRQPVQLAQRKRPPSAMLVADPQRSLVGAPHAIRHDRAPRVAEHLVDPADRGAVYSDPGAEASVIHASDTGRVLASFEPASGNSHSPRSFSSITTGRPRTSPLSPRNRESSREGRERFQPTVSQEIRSIVGGTLEPSVGPVSKARIKLRTLERNVSSIAEWQPGRPRVVLPKPIIGCRCRVAANRHAPKARRQRASRRMSCQQDRP